MTVEPISSEEKRASEGSEPFLSGGAGGLEVADGFLAISVFLRRYGKWLIGVPIFFGLMALLAQLWFLRPLHKATAIITVGPAPKAEGFLPPKIAPSAYLELALSANILENTAREMRQAGLFLPRQEMIPDQLQAQFGKPNRGEEVNTTLLLLTYWDDSPHIAAQTANAWARLLLDFDQAQVNKAALRWSIAEAQSEQTRLQERADRLLSRISATRSVLDSAPQGQWLSSRRDETNEAGSVEDSLSSERGLSLGREDRITVSAELAMRVAEAAIELETLTPVKDATEQRLAQLMELSDRIGNGEVRYEDLLEADTAGLLPDVRSRAALAQPATGAIGPAPRRLGFRMILAALAGFLLALAAAAVRETMASRTVLSLAH